MADYVIPPHLVPRGNPAEEYTRGLQLGATIANQRAQLQMAAEANRMRAEVQMRQLESEALQNQQRMMIQSQYNEQMLGLKQQELATAQQLAEVKTTEAARRYQIEAMAQAEIRAGKPAAEVWMKYGPMSTGSLAGTGALATAMKQVQPFNPREMSTTGGTRMIEIAPNRWQQARESAQDFTPTSTVVDGQKMFQTSRGRWTIPRPEGFEQEMKNGGFEAKPIFYPGTTNAIPGMAMMPTTGGGYTPRNIPDRRIAIAQRRLGELLKRFDREMLEGKTQPPKGSALEKLLPAAQKEYNRLNPIIEEALAGSGAGFGGPSMGVGHANPEDWPRTPDGRVKMTDPAGNQGTLPMDQVDDALAQGWKVGPDW